MLSEGAVVFLLDVDNTLIDNDRFGADLGAKLEKVFGAAERDRYWATFAALREEFSYADYLGALQGFRVGPEDARIRSCHLISLGSWPPPDGMKRDEGHCRARSSCCPCVSGRGRWEGEPGVPGR